MSTEDLVRMSSLGTPSARALRASVTDDVVADVLRRSESLSPVFYLSSRTEEEHGVSRVLREVLEGRFGPQAVAHDGLPPVSTLTPAATGSGSDQAQALVAIIGPRWLTAADDRGRRKADDPGDLVRTEIADALRGGMRVIPVLLDATPAVEERELPDDLRPLANGVFYRLRPNRTRQDLLRLLDGLTEARSGLAGLPGSVARSVDARLVGEVRQAIRRASWPRLRRRGGTRQFRSTVAVVAGRRPRPGQS